MRLSILLNLAFALLLTSVMVPCESMSQDPTPQVAMLRPGDVVRLKIWREPDLSGDFTVAPTGIVTLPRLGPRTASLMHPDSLRATILREYKRLITTPSIEVEFIRRVSVGGGVVKPGVFLVDEVMTVADAITMAGGAQRSNVADVELVRDAKPTGRTLTLGTRLSEVPVQSGDELRVPRLNWFKQNYQMVYVGISSVLAVVTILSVTRR